MPKYIQIEIREDVYQELVRANQKARNDLRIGWEIGCLAHEIETSLAAHMETCYDEISDFESRSRVQGLKGFVRIPA